MSMGWWGDTWSHFKWVLGVGWRKQKEAMCITLQFVVGCATSVCDTGARQDLGGLQQRGPYVEIRGVPENSLIYYYIKGT